MGHFSAGDENLGFQSGAPIPGLNPTSNQFGNAFCGAGSGLIREGLGAYGKRICGSSSQYVQSNIIKCFSDPQYYFQVNAHYVRNKLKIILFPFLHRGHWTRITEPIGGRLSYNPPINDINAPDLYIPFMTFATYLVLAGISLGLSGKFSPEALNWQFVKGMASWLFQAMLLKASLTSLGGGEAPLLDMIAYSGYTFTGLCVAVVGRITLSYAYYLIVIWTSMCSGIFLAKTIKLTLYAEARSYDVTIHNYLLLVNKEIHEFLLGDIRHPKKEHIYRKLEEPNPALKREGYSPATEVVLHDIDERQMEWALAIHSERLVICYGLRIVKNLRVCNDCHSMIKLIAKITKRKIMRDRSRFHRF